MSDPYPGANLICNNCGVDKGIAEAPHLAAFLESGPSPDGDENPFYCPDGQTHEWIQEA